jgi:hypothetical protein
MELASVANDKTAADPEMSGIGCVLRLAGSYNNSSRHQLRQAVENYLGRLDRHTT